ncbi:MAG: hypothetical protein SWK90_19255 [Chloroflexota bacterium]|nr:hypothetical protein [Chloroflexota bacterium]
MTALLENPLTDPGNLKIHAAQAEIVTWQDRQALRLEDGLVLIPGHRAVDASVEVLIGTDGAAYPGIAFRVVDVLNYDLAYAVPHASGQWDALQYDPVFHGSNTWQMYHGPCYQCAAQVPTGRWFRLRVDFCGSRAAVAVDGQSPLVVERLAHPVADGLFGLWTFRPAYFSNLRISTFNEMDAPRGEMPHAPAGAVEAWFAEGYGAVACEPNGVLNLNRYLPALLGEVRLTRRFEMPEEGEVTFECGFSDGLSLALDGEKVFEGENTFQGFADRPARGYVEQEQGMRSVRRMLSPGVHCLVAVLRVSEGFGWGLALVVHTGGENLRWLPVEFG